MESVLMKVRLEEYLDTVDEKPLRLLLAVAKEYSGSESDYQLTDE